MPTMNVTVFIMSKRGACRRIRREACVEADESPVQRPPHVTINTLPRHALLEIFKFYVDQNDHEDEWHTLVHVCREWRDIVFSSPRWLRLELRCTNRSPVKKMLDIWPPLPIVIVAYIIKSQRSGVANIMAALKRHNLVCRIKIWGVPNSLLKSAAIKKRFPQLTDLTLYSLEDNELVIPDSFLGGYAPRLRSLNVKGITFLFPALGNLLLSATDLVSLRLWDIQSSGYISPELVVTSLSALPKLKALFIGFRSPQPRADRERRHPTLFRRLVLPSLTELYFKGNSEYLEDIVGRIDTPALDMVTINFHNQLVFDTALLRDFFSRTEVFKEPHRADVLFIGPYIEFTLSQHEGTADRPILEVKISSRLAEWQLSSMAQFCTTSLPPLPTLERLSIRTNYSQLDWPSDMESSQWFELFHPFVTVSDLVLSYGVAIRVGPALGELTGSMVTEVLPALRQVFEESVYGQDSKPTWEAFAKFITARQLSGQSVVLHSAEIGKS